MPNSELPYESVRADELEEDDTLVHEDGSYDDTVYDVFTDESGTWLETSSDIGYVRSHAMFRIEPRE